MLLWPAVVAFEMIEDALECGLRPIALVLIVPISVVDRLSMIRVPAVNTFRSNNMPLL